MTNKWHPFDEPLPKAQDRCSQPRRHKYPNQENECYGSYEPKTYSRRNKQNPNDQQEMQQSACDETKFSIKTGQSSKQNLSLRTNFLMRRTIF